MHPDAPTPRAPRPPTFDRPTWNKLRGADMRLLDEIGYLSRIAAQRSPKRAHYAMPGRRWLAERLGCSVRTVTRITTKLARLGILNKRQRRPVRGRWQTCLYACVAPAGWAAVALATRIRSITNRRPKVAHKALPPLGKNNIKPPFEDLATILSRGRARWCPA